MKCTLHGQGVSSYKYIKQEKFLLACPKAKCLRQHNAVLEINFFWMNFSQFAQLSL